MSFLKDDVSLSDIFIPGSHDSGTYILSRRIQSEPLSELSDRFIELFCRILKGIGLPIWKIITPWATTQNQPIFYQALKSGARYFDLRAGWNGEEWTMFHMEEGEPVAFAFYDIHKFLRNHKKEIVIIEMAHYFGSPSKEAHELLRDDILEILGRDLYPSSSSGDLPSLGMMRSSNRRAILAFTDYIDPHSVFSNERLIWNQSLIWNTFADTDDVEEMVAYNKNKTDYFDNQTFPRDKLFKISWTLTVQTLTVFKGFFPNYPSSMRALTKPAISEFHKWAKSRKRRPSNILIFDYIFDFQIFPFVLRWNNLSSS